MCASSDRFLITELSTVFIYTFYPPASVGVTSSYSSSSGIYLGGDSSGGGEGGGSYIDGESFGRGGGGGSYMVSSVSKVRSSSSGGARRAQAAGSAGGLSPAFRERKTISSRSGGYDGKVLLVKHTAGIRDGVGVGGEGV